MTITPHDQALRILSLPEREQARALAAIEYPQIIDVKSAMHALQPKRSRPQPTYRGRKLSAKDETQAARDILDQPESKQAAALAEKPAHRIPYIKKAILAERARRAREAEQQEAVGGDTGGQRIDPQ